MRRLPRLALATALGLGFTACGGDDDDSAGDSTSTTAAAGTTTTAGAGTTTATAGITTTSASGVPDTTGAAATTTTGGTTDLEDGRHPAFLSSIDLAARTLGFDKVQLLTGDEAKAAWAEDHPDEPDGPPNDYYIVNENPQLRTLPVAADVAVTLVRLAEDSDADLDPGTWEELPAYLAASPDPDGELLSYSPYWLTVTAGTITGVEEQYLP